MDKNKMRKKKTNKKNTASPQEKLTHRHRDIFPGSHG